MSTTTIKPTVGRVVLVFFATASSAAMTGYALPTNANTPVPGLIARVHDDGRINVAAFDVYGTNLPLTNVQLLQEGDERPTSGCWAEWMPYQIGQAKKVEEREAKQLAAANREADDKRWRAGTLDMALRTPGLADHHDVLKAAAAYQAHIEGEKTTPAPSEREQALEELVRSACAIAERQGVGTAWDRFIASANALGLNGVTARTYRILPSDEQ